MNTTEVMHTLTTSVYKSPFEEVGVAITWGLLIPLCVFGVVANLITILVITTTPQLRSTFNYFIISLCVSDFVSALISPLHAYRRTWGFERWDWSDFLCKMFWAFDIWTSFVTSCHVLVFALLRFISIQWPFFFNKITCLHAKIVIAVIWTVTFCVSFIPFSIWFGASTRDRSSPLPNSKWPSCTLNIEWLPQFKLFTRVGYSIFFFTLMLMVLITSIGIYLKLKILKKARQNLNGKRNVDAKDKKKAKRERQVMVQLVLIVASFLLGYIPRTVFQYYTVSVPSLSYADRVFDWWFGSFEYFALRLSECLNPIFYNVASGKMRRGTVIFLRRISSRCSKLENNKSQSVITMTSSPNELKL